MEIKDLKEKIQQLITEVNDKHERQKRRLNFLIQKLKEVQELENIEKLKDYEKGRYFNAYLIYKSISQANFQPRHLKSTTFGSLENLLTTIDTEIENSRPKGEALPAVQTTAEQLLWVLGEKISQGEIKSGLNTLYLLNKEDQKIMEVELTTGKVEAKQAREFLEKFGLTGKK